MKVWVLGCLFTFNTEYIEGVKLSEYIEGVKLSKNDYNGEAIKKQKKRSKITLLQSSEDTKVTFHVIRLAFFVYLAYMT